MRSDALIFALLLLFSTPNLIAQKDHLENWIKLKGNIDSKLYIDINSINLTEGNDIYVWTQEYHDPPLIIESIDKEIFITKTHYLINKDFKKYSIIQVMYLDKDNNLIENFDYQRDTNIKEYQYNYPIMLDSDIDLIYEECLKLLWKE